MGFPKLPDPYPNAIRIAISVFTATAIGYGIVLPDQGIPQSPRCFSLVDFTLFKILLLRSRRMMQFAA
jgi:hypothetical protein